MRMRGMVTVVGLVGTMTACRDAGPTEPAPQPFVPDVVAGRAAFAQSCAVCHASGDGLDIAFFHFTDTTIIRRAVAHVDTLTARNIVAHIRSIAVQSQSPDIRLFQPGGRLLQRDVEFAVGLFGRDGFPADMTTQRMRALDPRVIPVAVPFPPWSDEARNIDWMPDEPLPAGILGYNGAAPLAAVAGYRAAPTLANLTRAVSSLRSADRNMTNPAAPCILEDAARVDYERCFQVRRWTSSLVAQHFIRNGMPSAADPVLTDIWWDVGNAARRSNLFGRPLENRVANWAAWMYLGWTFDPSRHASTYTGGALQEIGLRRHATFLALRSQVARPANNVSVYDDLRQAVRFAPDAWTYDVATFAFNHALERVAAGDMPRGPEDLARIDDDIRLALNDVNRKVNVALRPAIAALAAQLLASVPAH